MMAACNQQAVACTPCTRRADARRSSAGVRALVALSAEHMQVAFWQANDEEQEFLSKWIKSHADACHSLGKPFVLVRAQADA